MRLYGAFLHSRHRDYLQNIHIFHEPEQENRPLLSGQDRGRLPDRLHLLFEDRRLFR